MGLLTATEAAAPGTTVSVSDPGSPSIVAVATTVPGATVCSSPLGTIVATFASDVDQVADLPASKSPNWSRATTVSCTASPTVGLAVGLLTVTVVVTRGVTVNVKEPGTLVIVAVTVTAPPAKACSRPVAETVATAGAELGPGCRRARHDVAELVPRDRGQLDRVALLRSRRRAGDGHRGDGAHRLTVIAPSAAAGGQET